jgi:hypothetical protein
MPEANVEALYKACLHEFAGSDKMAIDTGIIA